MKEVIKNAIKESIALQEKLLSDENLMAKIQDVVNEVIVCFKNGGKVILFGNGGSSSCAEHICAEFIGKLEKQRNSLPCIALNTNVSNLTSLGNDYGFEQIFSRQISSLCKPCDVVIGLSTSGNSKNVYNAILVAKDLGAKCFGFLGKDGGIVKNICDESIIVPSTVVARIQEVHGLIGHVICSLVDKYYNE